MDNSLLLSANSNKSLQQNLELFTTSQIARQLNTSPKVILTNAKKCFPEKVYENGKPTYFNKAEVTILIEKLKTSNPNQYSFTGAVKEISTALTPALKIKQAMELMQEGYEEELSILRSKNAEMLPKANVYDELVDRSKTMNFRDMASKLGMSQTDFMTILKTKYIYKNSIGEYRAYAEYQKYFTLRTYNKTTDITGEQLLINMDGITYFINKYKPGEVANSFISNSEKEYSKIINKTAEKYMRNLEILYTLINVAAEAGESEETVYNYCLLQQWATVGESGRLEQTDYAVMKGWMKENLFTENGKNKLIAVFSNIRNAEKNMRVSSIGKAE